jgi:hypothetical protein
MLRAAPDLADLVFHALAFVPPRVDAPPLVRAASLHRPEWMRYAEEHLPPAAVVPIARDAPLVGALVTSGDVALALQHFVTLHRSIAEMLRTIRASLGELGPGDVTHPGDLAAITAAPPAPMEIFRAALGLAGRAFAAAHASGLHAFSVRGIEALRPRLMQLAAEVPGASTLEVWLSATLGPHGRLLDDAIVVGTRSLPHEDGAFDTDTPLAIVAHEAAVRAAGRALARRAMASPWALIERVALDCGAHVYRGTPAEHAYEGWRREVDTSGLAPRDKVTSALAEEAAFELRGASKLSPPERREK